MIKMPKKVLSVLLPIVLGIFSMGMLFLGLRGIPGNPSMDDLMIPKWQATGPFESSNDRGRFALVYSFLENHSFQFSNTVAQFATPDLAITEKGEYVSLFAPGVSFLVMPGYIIGKYFGSAQIGAYAVVAVFALLNVFLLYILARRLGAHSVAAGLAALTFLFATPAFTYAVSLSQHHFTVFALLLSLYLLIRFNNGWSLSLVWFLCAFSVVVDNPNFFLMFPVGLYALTKMRELSMGQNRFHFVFKSVYILTFVSMIFPIVFLGWFNQNSNGSVRQLSGTLERVLSVGIQQRDSKDLSLMLSGDDLEEHGSSSEKTAVGFFRTRNLLNGLDVHFLSPDRGLLWFAPVVLLGILGLIVLYRTRPSITAVLLASIGANILLYSMWGDPWGGWAFGSRYLIPTYALLCLGIAVALTQFRASIVVTTIFLLLFGYSVRVNTLGALGTSTIPPRVEVLALEATTGKVQKYDYERSRDYLYEVGSKSFAYQTFFSERISAYQYYTIVSSAIIGVGIILSLILMLANRRILV